MVKLPLSKRILVHAGILVGCIVMIYPLLWMFVSSFKPEIEIFRDPSLIPRMVTLQNYFVGWNAFQVPFGRFFLNSIIIVAFACTGTVITCSMAAYAFARLRFVLRKPLFAIMLATLMLPFHVTVIPQYIIFNELGWINTFLPLIVPAALGLHAFFIFLIVQFIRAIPRELDQQAEIDGCGPIRTYMYLIMPLSVPALMTAVILQFIWRWNDFFQQLLYLADMRLYTVTLALRQFVDAMGRSHWGPLFAMSVLSLLPMFIVFIFFQKYLIEGIVTGGVKG